MRCLWMMERILLVVGVIWTAVSAAEALSGAPAAVEVMKQMTDQESIYTLYKSTFIITDLQAAKDLCVSKGEILAAGLSVGQLQSITNIAHGRVNTWVNDCYTRTEWIDGKAESIYSATFEVNQCMQFVMSNGIAGGLKIASCGEQESPAICSRTVRPSQQKLNDEVFVISRSASFNTAANSCKDRGGELLVLNNLIEDYKKLNFRTSIGGDYWIGLRSRQLCASDAWIERNNTSYISRRTDALDNVLCSRGSEKSTTSSQTTKGTVKSGESEQSLSTSIQPKLTDTTIAAHNTSITANPSIRLDTHSRETPSSELGKTTGQQSTLQTSKQSIEDNNQTATVTPLLSGSISISKSNKEKRTNVTSKLNSPRENSTITTDDDSQKGLKKTDETVSDGANTDDTMKLTLYIVCGCFAAFVVIVVVVLLLIWRRRSLNSKPHYETGWELSSVENPSYHRKPEKRGTIPIRPGPMQSDKHIDQVPPLPAPRNSTGTDPKDYNDIYSVVPNEYDRVQLFEGSEEMYSTAGEYVDCDVKFRGNTNAKECKTPPTDDLYDECIPVSTKVTVRKVSSHYIEALEVTTPVTEHEIDKPESNLEDGRPESVYDLPPDENVQEGSDLYHDLEASAIEPAYAPAPVYHDLEGSQPAHHTTGNSDLPAPENNDIYDECEPVNQQTLGKERTSNGNVAPQSTTTALVTRRNSTSNATYDIPLDEDSKTTDPTYISGPVYHDLEDDPTTYYSTACNAHPSNTPSDAANFDNSGEIYDECAPL